MPQACYPPYSDPVAKLLHHSRCVQPQGNPLAWPDYVAELGLTADHIPDLIRLACDQDLNAADSEGTEVFAPTHAWRALGQLRAVESVRPLLGLLRTLDDEDFISEELPYVIRLIGPQALDAVVEFSGGRTISTNVAIVLTDAIGSLGDGYPEIRPKCIEALTEWLRRYKINDKSVNGFLISNMEKLRATSGVDLIREAYSNNFVDFMVCGDMEDVEILFGLRSVRSTPHPRYLPFPELPEPGTGGGWISSKKIGRNDPCICGSGKKYKKCCLH